MEPATVAVYEARGARWARARRPVRSAAARRLAAGAVAGRPTVDLGCGAGRYLGRLGPAVVGLDAARTMLSLAAAAEPGRPLVQGDLEALPFGSGRLGAAWASMSYLHVPRARLPLALWDLHRVLVPGAPVDLRVLAGDYEGHRLPADDIGGRFFCGWRADALARVLEGAGFDPVAVEADGDGLVATARRARTLADTVGPGMRLLVVGLNPSRYAADAGAAFARPGNRFWPALADAGVGDGRPDPLRALGAGIGLTDLVKRATDRADGLRPDEYAAGLERVAALARWLEPRAVCLVGLAGWRAAVDRRATVGVQPRGLGGRPCYLMPSTSGANAHAGPAELAGHLRAALALADRGV